MVQLRNARGPLKLSLRSSFLLSTAISLAAIGQANAQTHVDSGPGDKVYTTTAVSGTPAAVSVTSTDGTVTADIGTVTATATAGQAGDVVYMQTSSDKALTATIGTITATGEGDIFGFRANSQAGKIDIDIGTIDLAGNSTPGLIAQSTDGDIVLSADTVHTRGLNLNPNDSSSGDGVVGISTNGSVAVRVGNGQSDSLYGSVAVASAGHDATVDSTYAKTTGAQGAALYAWSHLDGDARVTSGTIDTTANLGAAINSIADHGKASATSGTINASGTNASGILARGDLGADVVSGAISTGGFSINAISAHGDASVVTTGDTVARTIGSGIYAEGGNVTVTTGAGTLTAAQGNAADYSGIYANARGDASVTNGGTVESANLAAALRADAGGTATITSDVAINKAGGDGIRAYGANGVTISSGSVEVRGNEDAYAINADSQGDIKVTSGAILSDGDGIDVSSNGGDVDITLNDDVDVMGGAVSAGGENVSITVAEGVTVRAGGGAVEAENSTTATIVNNGTIITTAANGEGGQAAILASASGDVTIVSNVASSDSGLDDNHYEGAAIVGRSETGNVSITAETTTSNGTDMVGVRGHSDSGNVTIDAGTTRSTAASDGSYGSGEAIYGSSGTGSVSITSENAEASGAFASAVAAATGSNGVVVVNGVPTQVIVPGGDVTIVSGVAKTTSLNSGTAVFGSSTAGDVSITTTGDTSSAGESAIAGIGRDVTIATAEGTTISGANRGITARATRDLVIDSAGAVTVSGRAGLSPTNHISGIDANAVGNIDVTATDVRVTTQFVANPQIAAAGIRAISNNGAAGGGTISIASGNVDVAGTNRFGIFALTSGDVTVTTSGDTVSAGGTGISATGKDVSVSTGTDTATVSGGSAYNAAIQVSASGNATVTNGGLAVAAGNAPTILVNAAGKATITSAETVNSGTGNAITATGANGVEIHAGSASTANAAYGILATATAGDVAIDIDSFDGSASLNAISGQANNGAVSITAGSVNNTNQNPNSWGIYGVAREGVTIVAGDVEASGQAIRAQTNLGQGANATIPLNDSHVSITTTGNVTSRTTNAISISGNVASFDVTIGADSVVTGNGGSAAVAGGARTGDISVTNNGKIVMQGQGESGIGVTASGGGDVTIVSNEILVDSDTAPTSGFTAGAISAVSQNGNGNVSVTSAKASVSGPGRYGMAVTTTGTGTVTVNSGELSKDADDYSGLYVRSEQGDISITSGTLTNSGVGAKGIDAISYNGGDISITSGTLVNSATGSTANVAEGIYADTLGAITVDAGSTEVHGYGASAIAALAGDAVNITSETAVTHGDDSTALYAGTWAGDVTVHSGSVTTSGTQASAIGVSTDDGATSVTSGTIDASGAWGYGIYAYGTKGASVDSATLSATGQNAYGIAAYAEDGDATVVSGDLTAARYGVYARSTSGNVSITLNGDTKAGFDFTPTNPNNGASQFGSAARGLGYDVTITTAADSTTSTGGAVGLEALASNSATIVNGGSLSVENANATGIFASAPNGIAITSNTIAISGEATDPGLDQNTGYRVARGGIVAEGGAGPISIDSGTITVAGDYRYGIFAHGNGAIAISSDSLTYEAADSAGIMVVGGDGDVTVDSGTLLGSGDSGAGIVVRTGTGNIAITADKTHLTGTEFVSSYTADAVVGISTGGTVSITSNDASTDGWAGSAIGAMGTSVTVNSVKASATGDLGAIVFAQATAGDATVTSGTITSTGLNTDALVARATGKAVIASTEITALGTDSTGITALGNAGNQVTTGKVAAAGNAVTATSTGGNTVVQVNGAVSSLTGYGVLASGINTSVTIDANASVSGAGAGISVSGTDVIIDNSGTITAAAGPAITASGKTHLINGGTITGGTGAAAVLLGAADDLVTLRTGSAVSGAIDMGGGLDTVELSGTAGANASTIARFTNAEALNVASGNWTTGTSSNSFETVSVASGARLQVNETPVGSGIETGNVVNNGTIALNFAGEADISDVAMTGTGDLRLIGAGTVLLTGDSIAHTGSTIVENGKLTLTGNLVSDIATTGSGVFELGDGGTFTGDLINDGTFIYARTDDYTVAGDFSGTGGLLKQGSGVLTFGGLYGFTGTTTINGGSVRFTGQLDEDTAIDLQSGTLDLSAIEGGQQTIGELAGTSGGSVELGSSQLTVNQETSTTFAGTISGDGGLVKSGSGTLNLTGTNTYSGDTEVTDGTLKVNGSLPNSTVMVQPGGTLGGNGLVGGIEAGGGTVAPGNSIGHLTVNGPVVFNAASVYAVEVNAAGAADRIDATGTATLGGATLQVLAEAGRYRGLTSYTILTAVGGVSGQFGTITSNFAFLTPSVTYGANSVILNLKRNDASFASLGTTPNERGVGNALQALGGGNALFEEALLLQDTSVAPNFASLSGEIHAGVASGMIENARSLRRTFLTGTVPPGEGGYGWAAMAGNWGTASATSSNLRLKTQQQGVMSGVGVAGNGFNGAIGVSLINSDFRSDGHARGESYAVLGMVGYQGNGFGATLGGSFAWNTFDTNRVATLGAIADSLRDEYKGTTWQVFGEVSYDLPAGPFAVTPFAGISLVGNRMDPISESGGTTALAIAKDDRKVTFTDLGVRLKGGDDRTVAPYASASWRRGWGDLNVPLTASFAGAAPSFSLTGPAIARDAAELGLGVEFLAGPARISVGYNGSIADKWSNHAVQFKVAIGF